VSQTIARASPVKKKKRPGPSSLSCRRLISALVASERRGGSYLGRLKNRVKLGDRVPTSQSRHACNIFRVVAMPTSRTIPDLLDELAARFPEREALVGRLRSGADFGGLSDRRGSQRAQKICRSSAILTARAVRRAHRIPPGRSPSPRGVRARESEMLARTECGCRRRRAAVASP
jgi:hypothetical protein